MSEMTNTVAQRQEVRELIPCEFPLQGAQLIEASAGTGKTWTIAALYVRLVLGHGSCVARGTGLVPPNILVVTFTDAATQELRDRIRSRLSEAARDFRCGATQADCSESQGDDASGRDTVAADEFLQTLRADYAPAEWALCARKLELAAEWMDEAAVSTIHSWCYKMLRQHAFDSGSLFTQELEKDAAPLLDEAVRDYWRAHLAPLSASVLRELRNKCASPDALRKAIRTIVADIRLIENIDQNAVKRYSKSLDAKWEVCHQLKEEWRNERWLERMEAVFNEAFPKKWINGNKIRATSYPHWLQKLQEWIDTSTCYFPELGERNESAWNRLTPNGDKGFLNAWNEGKAGKGPDLAPFEMFERTIKALDDALKEQSDGLASLMAHAADWSAKRFDELLRQRAQLGFNELLTRLDEALETQKEWGNKSASARRLIERIRQDFPVAMIDEFQDTDPVQYRIFKSIYLDRLATNESTVSVNATSIDATPDGATSANATPDGATSANATSDGATSANATPDGAISANATSADATSDTALIMIGDPKQAIYAFRGADIYTYLQARRACEGNLHTLKKNFRSTNAVVEAVNTVFERGEQTAQGAFLFKSGSGNPVPFVPATAQGRKEQLLELTSSEPEPVSALTLHYIAKEEKTIPKEQFARLSAAACAERIVTLLNKGAANPPQAGFSADGTTLIPLKPTDMAVLVNNIYEANAIRSALKKRGVRSVYLSEKDSVYDAPEARDLYFLLEACASPEKVNAVRTALAIPMLGRSLIELDRLGQDENALEQWQTVFSEFRDVWRQQGVLPMLRRVLYYFNVPARLLGSGSELDGERALTNTLHLAELLQQASDLLEGEQALIRYLTEQIFEGRGEGDRGDLQLRLESDEQLVKVVTVYKSKGLEYPLVFLPFASNARLVNKKSTKGPFKYHDENNNPCIALDFDNEELQKIADRERLGEDLRKLYVALTRARHATWVGLGETAELLSNTESKSKDKAAGKTKSKTKNATESATEIATEIATESATGSATESQTSMSNNALFHLLWGGGGASTESIPPFDGVDSATIQICEPVPVQELTESLKKITTFTPPVADMSMPESRTAQVDLRETWWVASYSAIAKQAAPEVDEHANAVADLNASESATGVVTGEGIPLEVGVVTGEGIAPEPPAAPLELLAPVTAEEEQFGEDYRIAEREASATLAASAVINKANLPHLFPGGTGVGTFLHGLFETMALEGFDQASAAPGFIDTLVQTACAGKQWDDYIPSLVEWIKDLVNTPLPLGHPNPECPATPRVALRELARVKPEMEFWVSASGVNLPTLDQLVRENTLGGAPRPRLKNGLVNGMLKGFIDLLFEYEGRYYVLDYKSNRLGQADGDYSSEAMREAILHSRYDLQYVLYLFALHRLLSARLDGYDYDTHVGGAVYLFLRGIHGPAQGVHFEKPPRELIEELDRLFSVKDKGVAA